MKITWKTSISNTFFPMPNFRKPNISIITPQPWTKPSIKFLTVTLAHLKYKVDSYDRPNHSRCQKIKGTMESKCANKTHVITLKRWKYDILNEFKLQKRFQIMEKI